MCFGAKSYVPSGSLLPTTTSGATVKKRSQIGRSMPKAIGGMAVTVQARP